MSATITKTQELTNALKISLSALSEAHPSQRDEVFALKEKLENQSLSSSQVTKEMRKIALNIVQAKDKDNIALNLAIEEASKKFKKINNDKNLSEKQRESIQALYLNSAISTPSLINHLVTTCLSFAEDALHLRSQSQVIVGDSNKRLKNSESNVIAGDVAWSSKQIVKSLTPLLQRVHQQFPDNQNITNLFTKSKELSKKNTVDFFEALSIMEESLRHITKAQGAKNLGDSEYLKVFHDHLKSMHATLSDTIKNNSTFQKSSKKDQEALNKLMAGFKSASENEDDPVKLKKIISDNINYMSESIDKVLKKQDNHINSQQRSMDHLRTEIRIQEKAQLLIKKENEELAQTLTSIENLSKIDVLTGIENRRSYDKKTQEMDLLYSKSKVNPGLGLIVIDIDRFKKLNDTYGHNVGDKALKSVVNLFKQALVKKPLYKNKINIYRYGGEEFVLTYSGISTREIIHIAEDIRLEVERKRYKVNDGTLNITVSIGVAYYSKTENTANKVFQKADFAMYRSKEKGRNRVSIFNQGETHTLRKRIR